MLESRINPPLRHECKKCGVRYRDVWQLYLHTSFCVIAKMGPQNKEEISKLQKEIDEKGL